MPDAAPRDGTPSRRRRLTRREIASAFSDGSRLHGRRVVLYAVLAQGPPRAAAVAGRKVGGAVRRNRARRIIREAWSALAPGVRDGYQVVIVARPEIGGARMQDLIEEVGEVLARAGLMRT